MPNEFITTIMPLQAIVKFLKTGKILNIVEDIDKWNIEIETTNFSIIKNPKAIFSKIELEKLTTDQEKFIFETINYISKTSLQLIIQVARSTNQIVSIILEQISNSHKTQTIFTFSSGKSNVWKLPPNALISKQEILSFPSLFIKREGLGGWMEYTHRLWASKSIKQLQKEDTENLYREIYDEGWGSLENLDAPPPSRKIDPVTNLNYDIPNANSHPIIIGAHWEDHHGKNGNGDWPDYYNNLFDTTDNRLNNDYYRDYNHYGGENEGLLFEDFMNWDEWFGRGGHIPPRYNNNRFFSAMKWGYGGISDNYNFFTFNEAIRQYNQYTSDGIKRAYIILGHTLHLLQDQAQPDHSFLVSHAGSSKTRKEAYDTFNVKTILDACVAIATTVLSITSCGWLAFICAPVIATALIVLINDAIDTFLEYDNNVGFELLAREYWKNINSIVIKKPSEELNRDFPGFFKYIAKVSQNIALKKGLYSPLGLGYLYLDSIMWIIDVAQSVDPFNSQYPHIFDMPDVDPQIDISSTTKMVPYISLIDEIAAECIGVSVDFMKYFFEIVNHPPYIEHVKIVKGPPDLNVKPNGFGNFDQCSEYNLVFYDIIWEDQKDPSDSVVSRRKWIKTDIMFSTLHTTYIFVKCGPNIPIIGPNGDKKIFFKKMKNMFLQILSPDNNSIANISLEQAETFDPVEGTFFWARFPSLDINGDMILTLSINGYDDEVHLSSRIGDDLGNQLDSNPAIPAIIDAEHQPLYNFVSSSYTPGPDTTNSIKIEATKLDNLNNHSPEGAILLNLDKPLTQINYTLISETDYFKTTWNATSFKEWLKTSGYGILSESGIWVEVKERFGGKLIVKGGLQCKKNENSLDVLLGFASPEIGGQNTFCVSNENPNCQSFLSYTLRTFRTWNLKPFPLLVDRWWSLKHEPEDRRIIIDGTVVYLDPAFLIQDLERLIPIVIEIFNVKLSKERELKKASIYFEISQIAYTSKLFLTAEKYCLKAIKIYKSFSKIPNEKEAMIFLQKLYKEKVN